MTNEKLNPLNQELQILADENHEQNWEFIEPIEPANTHNTFACKHGNSLAPLIMARPFTSLFCGCQLPR